MPELVAACSEATSPAAQSKATRTKARFSITAAITSCSPRPANDNAVKDAPGSMARCRSEERRKAHERAPAKRPSGRFGRWSQHCLSPSHLKTVLSKASQTPRIHRKYDPASLAVRHRQSNTSVRRICSGSTNVPLVRRDSRSWLCSPVKHGGDEGLFLDEVLR